MVGRIITAVAFYGPKEGVFEAFLTAVQRILREGLGARFGPYRLDRIHSTIIGLEGAPDEHSGGVVNERFRVATGSPAAMKFPLALDILTGRLAPPIGCVLGGCRRATPATFVSQGKHSYERMFAFRDNAFVLIGWPLVSVINGISLRPLDDLRREMNEANIGHRYHQSPVDIDNDLHLVIGHLDGSGHPAIDLVERDVRAYMADHPCYVEVGVDQVSIVAADAPSLATASFVGSLSIGPAEIEQLYRYKTLKG
jgi:hypothetical protein